MSLPRQDRTPTDEGRPLPRPDEELVDQGLGFDVGTLLCRRRLLTVLELLGPPDARTRVPRTVDVGRSSGDV